MGYQGMTKAEGDRIAYAVLELVRQLANQATPKPVSVLDRNIRPEPPEATLGHMPSEAPQVPPVTVKARRRKDAA